MESMIYNSLILSRNPNQDFLITLINSCLSHQPLSLLRKNLLFFRIGKRDYDRSNCKKFLRSQTVLISLNLNHKKVAFLHLFVDAILLLWPSVSCDLTQKYLNFLVCFTPTLPTCKKRYFSFFETVK